MTPSPRRWHDDNTIDRLTITDAETRPGQAGIRLSDLRDTTDPVAPPCNITLIRNAAAQLDACNNRAMARNRVSNKAVFRRQSRVGTGPTGGAECR